MPPGNRPESVSSVLSLFLLPFLLVIFVLEHWGSAELYVSMSLVALGLYSIVSLPRFGLFPFGLFLCILPICGSGALSLFCCAWLLGLELRFFFISREAKSISNGVKLAASFFLLPIFASALYSWLQGNDWLVLNSIFDSGGLKAVFQFLVEGNSKNKRILFVLSDYALGVFLVRGVFLVLCSPGVKASNWYINSLLFGLATGAIFCALVVFLQVYYYAHDFFLLQQDSYWSALGRYRGSLTDPNALGVLGTLLAPMLFFAGAGRNALYFRLASLLFLSAAFWSGSRTIWLGLGLWLVATLWSSLKTKESTKNRKLLFFALFLSLAVPLICGQPGLNRLLQEHVSSPSSTRLLKTINWEHGANMFSSRVAYTRLALEIWSHSPFFGIGLSRFYDVQGPAAKRLELNLGSWRDNANNFYLEVLVEQGLLGLCLIFLSLFLLAKALAGKTPNSTELPGLSPRLFETVEIAIAVLFAILLTGPHVSFDEIRYFAAALIGLQLFSVERLDSSVLPDGPVKLRLFFVVSTFAYAIFGVSFIVSKPVLGFYGLERGASGEPYRWMGSRAKLALCLTEFEPTSYLQIQAPRPDVTEANPLKVRVNYYREAARKEVRSNELSIEGTSPLTLKFPFPEDEHSRYQRRYIEISVDRLWHPRGQSSTGDPRWLGLVVKWPKNVCEPK